MTRQIPEIFTQEWISFVQKNEIAFNSLDDQIFTKDGLLPSREIIITSNNSSYNLWLRKNKNILLYPSSYSKSVTRFLIALPKLWECTSLRVNPNCSYHGRAIMFGVYFKRAVQIALEKRFIKSEFYLPYQRDDIFYATLLIHINRRKESNEEMLELQAWQYCPGQSEVFYIHAESPDFLNTVTHLDGAIIKFEPSQIKRLFKEGKKLKSKSYKKQFRLDGKIPLNKMYNIIESFMPLKQLVQEAFETRKIIRQG